MFAGLAIAVAIAMVDWWTAPGPAITVVYVLSVLLVAREATRGSALWMAGLASGLSMLALFRTTGLSPMWASIGELVPMFLVLWAAAILVSPRREDYFDRSAVASEVEVQVLQRTKDLARANRDLEARRAEAVSLLAALVKSSDDAIIGTSPPVLCGAGMLMLSVSMAMPLTRSSGLQSPTCVRQIGWMRCLPC